MTSRRKISFFQHATTLFYYLSFERYLHNNNDGSGPFPALRTAGWPGMQHSCAYIHPSPSPCAFPNLIISSPSFSFFCVPYIYHNTCLLSCVCNDRMETVHVRTQPTAQPKGSTSQVTAPAPQTSNAASKKPATPGQALASV